MLHALRLLRPVVAVAAFAMLPACRSADTITAPALPGAVAQVILEDDALPTRGTVKVCAWNEANSYRMSSTGGGTLLGATMRLQAEGGMQCAVVWQSNGSMTPGVVTVTAATNFGMRPERIWVAGMDGEAWYDSPVASVSIRADASTDAVIWFRNVRVDASDTPAPGRRT